MSKNDIKKAITEAIQKMPKGEAIERVRLFGSHLHGDARPDSDIDLLVDFDKLARISLFDLVDIRDTFSESLGMKVDLGTADGLSKYIRERVVAEAEVLYER